MFPELSFILKTIQQSSSEYDVKNERSRFCIMVGSYTFVDVFNADVGKSTTLLFEVEIGKFEV